MYKTNSQECLLHSRDKIGQSSCKLSKPYRPQNVPKIVTSCLTGLDNLEVWENSLNVPHTTRNDKLNRQNKSLRSMFGYEPSVHTSKGKGFDTILKRLPLNYFWVRTHDIVPYRQL